MDRRGFLKFVTWAVGAGLAPALPLPVGAAKESVPNVLPDFDPNREYGFAFRLFGDFARQSKMVMKYLHESARQHLPSGSVYEIRSQRHLNYGTEHAMAWYYHRKLSEKPLGDLGGSYDKSLDCFLHGRFKTP